MELHVDLNTHVHAENICPLVQTTKEDVQVDQIVLSTTQYCVDTR